MLFGTQMLKVEFMAIFIILKTYSNSRKKILILEIHFPFLRIGFVILELNFPIRKFCIS